MFEWFLKPLAIIFFLPGWLIDIICLAGTFLWIGFSATDGTNISWWIYVVVILFGLDLLAHLFYKIFGWPQRCTHCSNKWRERRWNRIYFRDENGIEFRGYKCKSCEQYTKEKTAFTFRDVMIGVIGIV